MLRSTNLRPGLLVSLKTALRGGVDYRKVTIQPNHLEDGAAVEKWETTRIVDDPEEHARGVEIRGKARSLITSACCLSSFGLLCPDNRESELADAIAAAQALAQDFNATARATRLEVNVLAGRIAHDDVQAAKAIGSEVRDLLAAMDAGVRAMDPSAIREAADRARAVSGMLDGSTQERVKAAIDEVRKVARELVRAQKAGESAALIVEEAKLRALDAARFSVLDMMGERPDVPLAEPAAPAGRAVDFEPEAPKVQSADAVSQVLSNPPQFDLEV